MGLRNKDLISIHDLSVGEVATILDVAKKLKRKQKNGEPHQYLKGKTLGMIFSKASTRTRVSFEVGFWQLGGHPIYLNDSASQIGRGEPVRDTARVLSRFVDGIMIRTFSHESVLELAKYASIPVINGLTDMLHPCQALTDLFTIMEYKEVLKGRKLVYVGDGNNMAHSLMYACAKVGMNMVCACPQAVRLRLTMICSEPRKVLMYFILTFGRVWVKSQNNLSVRKLWVNIRSIKNCWQWPGLTLWFCIVCLHIAGRK